MTINELYEQFGGVDFELGGAWTPISAVCVHCNKEDAFDFEVDMTNEGGYVGKYSCTHCGAEHRVGYYIELHLVVELESGKHKDLPLNEEEIVEKWVIEAAESYSSYLIVYNKKHLSWLKEKVIDSHRKGKGYNYPLLNTWKKFVEKEWFNPEAWADKPITRRPIKQDYLNNED